MRIVRNTTDIPTPFLRKFLGWALRELDWKQNDLNKVSFMRTARPTSAKVVTAHGKPAHWSSTKKVLVVHDLFVWVGPAAHTDPLGSGPLGPGRLFAMLVQIGARLEPRKVPEGDLGVYRQPVGKKFVDNADKLIATWAAAIPATDPLAAQKAKLKLAEKNFATWTRRHKLATTKLKVWGRRVKAARRAIEKRG